MKRIYVNLTDEQAARLKERQKDLGVPIAEQIRRAVSKALDTTAPIEALTAAGFQFEKPRNQPVLFVANPKQETR